MSENKLYDLYIGLIPNLVSELLFYIPEKEIAQEIIDEFNELKNNKLFDRVFVFDEYRGPIDYDKKASSKGLAVMAINHEKNLFIMVEKQEAISNSEFKFLLEKYITFVEVLLQYSKWMHGNLHNTFEEDEKLKILFNNQCFNFKKHLEALVTTFYDSKKLLSTQNFKMQRIVDDFIPDLAKSFTKSKISDFILQPNPIRVPELNVPKGTFSVAKEKLQTQKSTKKAIVTEQLAEKILLETYFGIK
ncbi:hypothetical protein [Winogradskyella ursingii]|uniref:hypothetical protein n=1 Tax=Winogradskyella ursingii TaxID=2686079 RepID=UPI0015CA23D7|nr:hypothetical protein [Winogradskyella ursingii]